MSDKKRDCNRMDITVQNAGFEIATTIEKLQEELRIRVGSDLVRVTDLYFHVPTKLCHFDATVDRKPGDIRKPFTTSFIIRSNSDIESALNFAGGWLRGLGF